MTYTWDFTGSADRLTANDMPDDYVWERLRLRRNALLAACDFRVLSDAPWDIEPWIEYRQALRNLPANTTDPRQALWPTPPQ